MDIESPGDIIQLALAENPTLYSDRSYRPMIRFQGDPLDRPWPVKSQRTLAWIAEVCHQHKAYPTQAMITTTILVLAGLAWKNVQATDDDGLLEAVLKEPIVNAVLGFMEDRHFEEYRGLMTEALTKLKIQVMDFRSDLYLPQWPKGPTILSRRLKVCSPLLHDLGIDVNIKHTNRGSRVKFTAVPGSDGDLVRASHQSSQVSSHVKSEDPTGLLSRDDSDGQQEWALLAELKKLKENS